MVGDFNLHVDTSDHVAKRFVNLLRSFNLVQHVNSETHSNGHTLVLVITRCDENFFSKLETFNPPLSDHLLKQVTKSKLRAFRKMRSFDVDKFCLELSNSELLTSTPVDDLRVLVDCYNSTLNTLIDLHAPFVYKPVTLRSRAPWFTEEIRSAKKLRRKVERKWRTTKSNLNNRLFVDQCRVVNDLIRDAKEVYFSSVIEDNHGNQRVYFIRKLNFAILLLALMPT